MIQFNRYKLVDETHDFHGAFVNLVNTLSAEINGDCWIIKVFDGETLRGSKLFGYTALRRGIKMFLIYCEDYTTIGRVVSGNPTPNDLDALLQLSLFGKLIYN